MEFQFRKAAAEDLDEICAIAARAVQKMRSGGLFQWSEAYPARADFEQDIENGELIAGTADGKIAVFYTFNREFHPDYKAGSWSGPEEGCYTFHRLCVDPAVQGCGAGKAALANVDRQVQALGGRAVRIDTMHVNTGAMTLYRKCGYRPAGSVTWPEGEFCLLEKILK